MGILMCRGTACTVQHLLRHISVERRERQFHRISAVSPMCPAASSTASLMMLPLHLQIRLRSSLCKDLLIAAGQLQYPVAHFTSWVLTAYMLASRCLSSTSAIASWTLRLAERGSMAGSSRNKRKEQTKTGPAASPPAGGTTTAGAAERDCQMSVFDAFLPVKCDLRPWLRTKRHMHCEGASGLLHPAGLLTALDSQRRHILRALQSGAEALRCSDTGQVRSAARGPAGA